MHFSSPHHHLKWRSLMSPLSHLLLLSGSFLFSQCPTIEKQQNCIIGHFRDSFYLCFKTSLGAQPFIWKWVLHLCLLSFKLNSFPYERLCTKTRSETEAKGNSEMAYSIRKQPLFLRGGLLHWAVMQLKIFYLLSLVSW